MASPSNRTNRESVMNKDLKKTTRESVFDRMLRDQETWKSKYQGEKTSPRKSTVKKAFSVTSLKDSSIYEESDSMSSDHSTGIDIIKPTQAKIIMRPDKVRKEKKSSLMYYFNNCRKIDFRRKNDMKVYESSQTGSNVSCDSKCFVSNDIRK